jgi:hypothetical protein
MEIVELLESKNFEELSRSEKEMVLSEISEAEYIRRRNILFLAKKLQEKEKNISPNPLIKKQLMERMFIDSPVRVPLWQRSVPAWAMAASLCAVMLLSWFLMQKTNSNPPIFVEKKVILHDTIFQEINVPSIKYVTKTEKIYIETEDFFNIHREEKNMNYLEYSPVNFAENDILTSKGQSMAEDSLSWYLLQQVRSEIQEK